ncbi:MAG: hypothetical protein JXA46_15760 [Dehalococcoidales bacterium]|nr:hypothetical protein [Dehalococcoidales bacterium]
MLTLSGFSTNTPLNISSSGFLQDAVKLQTTDGLLSIEIIQGTKLLSASNSVLTSLSVTPSVAPPQAPEGNAIVLAFAFAPDGAKFDPALTLTIAYGLVITSGIAENDLYIAYFDGTQWQKLETTVDILTKNAIAKVPHFSNFALIGKVLEPAPAPTTAITTPTITSALAPVSSPSTTVVQAQTPTESSLDVPIMPSPSKTNTLSSSPLESLSSALEQPNKQLSHWMIILFIVIGIVVILAICLIAIRSRKKETR